MTWGGVIKHKKIIIFSLLIIVVAILLTVVINNVTNKSYAASTYLYDKVKTDATTNGYGGTYSGDHADSVQNDGTEIVGNKAIYYYNTRGYGKVHFGNWCWQIIRTTDTGGVKLIYDGAYSSSTGCSNSGSAQQIGISTFNSTRTDALYVGLKYASSSYYNDINSTILEYLNTWYESNLSSYEPYLEDTVFCNDRTGDTSSSSAATGTTWRGSGTSAFYYHNYDSSYNKLSCYNYRDRFTTNNTSAQLSHPIGLMSAPEYKLGGGYTSSDGSSNVHYTGSAYWLVSPYYYGSIAYGPRVDASGELYGDVVNRTIGVRPVISLNPYITYVSGSGTSSSPYEIGEVQLPERTSSYLYDVVEQDATDLRLGETYTDDHADTVEDDGTEIVGGENIYYYNKKGYNNVKFGDFCWQIIRTTDTGGVKLIYNGAYSSSTKCNNSGTARQLSSTSKFNDSYNNRIYVGYKYKSGSTYNATNSTIKTAIDNWYSSNMTSYTSQLEDTVFCNDRTGSTSSGSAATGTTWAADSSTSTFYYHNYSDSYNKLSCYDKRDRFTTNNTQAQLSYPVALATAPEWRLMDSATRTTGQSWWLLSPLRNNSSYAMVRRMPNSTLVNDYYVNTVIGVRPVVSLVPDIKYSSGTGTVSDPYIIDSVGTKVKYSAGSYGTLSGTTSEDVSSGGHPTGRDVTPNSGYYFAGWVANKNVTLSNNTTISRGTVMTKAQTQSINVTSSITLTAQYYKGWLYDAVETDVTTNGYGGTYSGDHADTVQNDGIEIVGTKNIYHYNTRGYGKVKFGNWCWQIIRTTDTGGIKLIYDGTYSSSTGCSNSGDAQQLTTEVFNSTYDNAKYVGYKYKTTNYNDTDSTIKTYIDNWYESNLSSYESYLEDTVFCNDRTGSTTESSAATGTTWNGSGTSNFYYHNYDAGYNKLYCDDIKDRFTTNNTSAQLSHPIGLMSAPEYKLGGGYTSSDGSNNVHYTGSYYWLVAPYLHNGGFASVSYVNSSGKLYASFVFNAYGVRPVVSLAPNMTYVGSGTSADPYDVSAGVVNPEVTATFYYQSSSTSGTTNISSVTTSCTPSGGSCSAEIPSAVRSSVGTYNNSYAGLNTSTGSMSTPVGSSATTVTLTSDTTYYAVYRSSVTNYYYSN